MNWYNVCCEQISRFVLLNQNQHETILTAHSGTFIYHLNNQVIDFKESKHNLLMLWVQPTCYLHFITFENMYKWIGNNIHKFCTVKRMKDERKFTEVEYDWKSG